MITLGIETSGPRGSVALLSDGNLLGDRDLSREGRRHARTLLAELQGLLEGLHLTPRDVETIAVSIGPGSFTGLRVGVTCAKTWAYATGCRLVAVETFLAIAERSQSAADRLDVISDAQRGELFVGRFLRRHDCTWQRDGDTAIVTLDEWVGSLTRDIAVSGPAVDPLRARIAAAALLEPAESCHPRAEEVARIGQRRGEVGATDDVWGLEPLYLRKSAAEEQAE